MLSVAPSLGPLPAMSLADLGAGYLDSQAVYPIPDPLRDGGLDENSLQLGAVGATVQILDNGDSGFQQSGAWVQHSGQGYGSGILYSAAGTGHDLATWTFSVTPGQYQVAATWTAHANRATNSPFTVYDGATALEIILVDQEVAPGGGWHTLGTYTITANTLNVRLTDNADEYVIADAVRIERLADLPAQQEIKVTVDGGTIPVDVVDNTGNVNFGSTTIGTPITRTFTVLNLGIAPLTLGTITIPSSGFSLASGLGATTLQQGESTTFALQLDADAAATFTNEPVSMVTDDGDENPFNFTVDGSVSAARIVDNGNSGFHSSGQWTGHAGQGFGNDIHYSAAGAGTDVATWTFSVTPGQYQVATTWTSHANRATNSPFTVYDGSTSLGTVRLNQESAPSFFTDQGVGWDTLGTFHISGDTLSVRLTDNANGYVIADAVRIEHVGALPEGIVDNRDAGFSYSGPWQWAVGQGYRNGLDYNAAGTGHDLATWTFSVTPGRYQVATTWVPHANRATNSPFTVYDGSTPLGTVRLDQEAAPDDFADQGVGWEILGEFEISRSTLNVRLSDDANQYVIADAVRIEQVGPEIEVSVDGQDVADNTGNVDFGSTVIGEPTPPAKTFTVRNSGVAALTLGAITVPTGFSIQAGFGSTTLQPGESTTFVLQLDVGTPGTFTGQVSFTTDDTSENPFNFSMVGSVAASRIVDNEDSGFSTAGSWTPVADEGYQDGIHYSAAGAGGDVATWTFSVPSGDYLVAATWSGYANPATDAPFEVFDNATSRGTAQLDQGAAPDDFTDQGVSWETIGTFNVTSGTLNVTLNDNADGNVIADAIRIEQVAPEIQVTVDGQDVADAGTVDFGTTDLNQPVTKTFTVTNVGFGPLTLGTMTIVNSSFRLITPDIASTVLQHGESATFTLELDAATHGTNNGQVSFATNDADENPFDVSLTGVVSPTQIVDNGDPGFSRYGDWTWRSGQGNGNDIDYSAAGAGNDLATWTFWVSPGTYQVDATWSPHANRATNAPFTVYDGSTSLGTVPVNQELAPGGGWLSLGTYAITANTLNVRLTDNADEYVIADAIRITRQ